LKYGFQPRVKGDPVQPAFLESKLPPEKVLDVRKGIVQIGGDENMYRELLSDFIEGLPKRRRAIQNYFAEKDLVELSRTAHNLSGIAANLGASQLSDCAKKLDKQSVEGYTESLDPLVQEIQLVIVRLLEFSNNYLAEKQVNTESV
jgi:HPt (histidine-containing phosphotransfer) domain-containing protein